MAGMTPQMAPQLLFWVIEEAISMQMGRNILQHAS